MVGGWEKPDQQTQRDFPVVAVLLGKEVIMTEEII